MTHKEKLVELTQSIGEMKTGALFNTLEFGVETVITIVDTFPLTKQQKAELCSPYFMLGMTMASFRDRLEVLGLIEREGEPS